MRVVKRIFVIGALFILVLALGACSALSDAANLQSYDFGNDQVPSITSVVGERTVTGVSTGTGTGGQYKEFKYKADDPIADIQAYINVLQNQGWIVTQNDGDGHTSGTVQIGIESVDIDMIILVTITYDTSSYTLYVNKVIGTLNRY